MASMGTTSAPSTKVVKADTKQTVLGKADTGAAAKPINTPQGELKYVAKKA